jgi:hypothetical protein
VTLVYTKVYGVDAVSVPLLFIPLVGATIQSISIGFGRFSMWAALVILAMVGVVVLVLMAMG